MPSDARSEAGGRAPQHVRHESTQPELRFLLDEHYPPWLADELVAAGLDVVCLARDRPALRGADDDAVLSEAAAEGRVVVTEDVTTFDDALRRVPGHVGVVFCHAKRFPRTRPGLRALSERLLLLAQNAPAGLGGQPVQWWLATGE